MLWETRTRIRKPLRRRPNEFGHLDWKLSFCWRRLLSTGSRGECIRFGLCVCFCGRLCHWTSGRPADSLQMVFFMIRSIATCNEPLVSAEESATRAASHAHLPGTLVHWRASICPGCTSRCGLSRILDRCEFEGAALECLLGVIYASTLIQSMQERLPSVDPLSASSLWDLRRMERCLVNTCGRQAILHMFKGGLGENPIELILLGNPRRCEQLQTRVLRWDWCGERQAGSGLEELLLNSMIKQKTSGTFVFGIYIFSRCLCGFSRASPPHPPHSPKTWMWNWELTCKLSIGVCVCVREWLFVFQCGPTTNCHVKHLPLRCHCLEVKGYFHIALQQTGTWCTGWIFQSISQLSTELIQSALS